MTPASFGAKMNAMAKAATKAVKLSMRSATCTKKDDETSAIEK